LLPLAAFAALSGAPTVSFAQTTEAEASSVAAEATVEGRVEAQRLYEAGLESFNGRDYEAALTRFSEAYRLSPAPLLIYNMAQAQRLRGECAAALLLYRDFLGTAPSGKARELAESREGELSQQCEVSGSAPAVRTSTPAVSELPSRPRPLPATIQSQASKRILSRLPAEQVAQKRNRTAVLLSFGSALALFGVSGYFAWRADRAADQVSNVFVTRGTWNPELAERERQGIRDARISVASLIGGFVAAGTGTYLWTFD
jgi:hypothetical protein